MVSLWERCGLVRSWNDPYRDIERKQQVQPELFLVGVYEEELVASAMAGYDGHRGNVYYLCVDPRFRGQRFGQTLMQAVEQRLLGLGCPKVNVMVRTSNLTAERFYEGCGYQRNDVVSYGKRLIVDRTSLRPSQGSSIRPKQDGDQTAARKRSTTG